MSTFAIIQTEVWRDPAFTELEADARLLFLWAWTNPDAAIGGLYQLPPLPAGVEGPSGCDPSSVAFPLPMQLAIGDSPTSPGYPRAARVEQALVELERKPLMFFDPHASVVWVVNRAAHSNRSPKAAAIMVKEFARCPASPLKDAFYARYEQMLRLDRVTC